MSHKIRQAVWKKLVSDTSNGSLYDLVGGRIYEGQPHQTADLPCLVYRVESNPLTKYYGGCVQQNASVVFELYGRLGNRRLDEGSQEANELGKIEEALFDLIELSTLTVDDHDRGVVFCISRGVPSVTDESHVLRSEYQVKATEL